MFDKASIEKEKQEFQKLFLAPEHRSIVDDMAKIVLRRIEIDPLALKGFVWRAMKKWQIENNLTMRELATKSKSDRVVAVKKITEMTRDSIKRVLKNKSDESLVDQVFEEVFQAYVSKWSDR